MQPAQQADSVTGQLNDMSAVTDSDTDEVTDLIETGDYIPFTSTKPSGTGEGTGTGGTTGGAGAVWNAFATGKAAGSISVATGKARGKKRGKRQRLEEEEDTGPPGTYLWEVLMQPSAEAANVPSPLLGPDAAAWAQQQRDMGLGPSDAIDPDIGLNRSQILAVAQCLQARVALVQGPPGTGMPTTVQASTQLLSRLMWTKH